MTSTHRSTEGAQAVARTLRMALQSPAVAAPERQQLAKPDNAEITAAQQEKPACVALKPENAVESQIANSMRPEDATSQLDSGPASQSGLSTPAQIPQEGTNNEAPTSVSSGNDPQEGQLPKTGVKSETGPPSSLEVVCADVQGLMILDFQKMRCFIQYKGDCIQLGLDCTAVTAGKPVTPDLTLQGKK